MRSALTDWKLVAAQGGRRGQDGKRRKDPHDENVGKSIQLSPLSAAVFLVARLLFLAGYDPPMRVLFHPHVAMLGRTRLDLAFS